jgi:hypothetical protein
MHDLPSQLDEANKIGHTFHQLFELQPTLGVDVSAEADGKGLRVLGVEPAAGGRGAGPAAVAGIGKGDSIAAINGVPVKTKAELDEQVARLTAGDRVPIEVRDGSSGKPRSVEAVVGAVGVDSATVDQLRGESGGSGAVWKRPEEWKRVRECFLHPSEARRIAELEQALADAQADGSRRSAGGGDRFRRGRLDGPAGRKGGRHGVRKFRWRA